MDISAGNSGLGQIMAPLTAAVTSISTSFAARVGAKAANQQRDNGNHKRVAGQPSNWRGSVIMKSPRLSDSSDAIGAVVNLQRILMQSNFDFIKVMASHVLRQINRQKKRRDPRCSENPGRRISGRTPRCGKQRGGSGRYQTLYNYHPKPTLCAR